MGKNNKFKDIVKRVQNYFLNNNNVPIFFFLVVYSIVLAPLCFLNNDYFNLLSAFHVDSGSIIGSLFTIMNKNIFYNQNLGYHTRFYGFPYNSILFFSFVFIRKIFHLSVVDNFPVFALTARLISFVISIITIFLTYLVSLKIFKKTYIAIFTIIFLVIFPGFSFYSSLIKPDILALLFLTLSFFLVFNYFKSAKLNYYLSAIVFAALSTFTKQQYIFVGVPLIIAYFIKDEPTKINFNFLKNFFICYLKATFIIIPLFFLIHPFSFINFSTFVGRQRELAVMTSAPVIENVRFWLLLYQAYPVLLFGFLSSFYILIMYFFDKNNNPIKKFIFFTSIFSFIYTLWLTLFVGPIRVEAYLLPVFSTFIIVQIYLFFQLNHLFKIEKKSKLLNFKKILLNIFFLSVFIISFVSMLKNSINLVSIVYNFKKTYQVSAVNDTMSHFPLRKHYNQTKIIFTVSLPFPQYKFKEAKNIWQFNFGKTFIKEILTYNPDIIAVDTTQYYEQGYTWWKTTASNLGLSRNIIYLKGKIIKEIDAKKINDKNVIIIFYK